MQRRPEVLKACRHSATALLRGTCRPIFVQCNTCSSDKCYVQRTDITESRFGSVQAPNWPSSSFFKPSTTERPSQLSLAIPPCTALAQTSSNILQASLERNLSYALLGKNCNPISVMFIVCHLPESWNGKRKLFKCERVKGSLFPHFHAISGFHGEIDDSRTDVASRTRLYTCNIVITWHVITDVTWERPGVSQRVTTDYTTL